MSTPANNLTASTLPERSTAVDTYRGLVMFLMMAEVLHLGRVAKKLPDCPYMQFLAFHQSHVEWIGCSLHDMIQPSFSFLVGVALPFSLASRRERGQSCLRMFLHAIGRALILIFLGIFLRSINRSQTYYTFEDTLTQIGLGYVFLFLLGMRSMTVQFLALIVVLLGYWGAFALYPAPGPDFDWAAVGVPANWPHHLSGFEAHWNKNSNLAWAFDRWFLNLFPRESPFVYNGGGYATLSFIPTLGTMILGLLAGGILKSERTQQGKLAWFIGAGVVCLGLGFGLGELGVCPVVKRIWTPTWALYSGGWCFLFLAGFYLIVDVARLRRWAFPLVVIGMNSIAAYCLAETITGFIGAALNRHLGKDVFLRWGEVYQPMMLGAGILLVLWGVLYWMYRQRIFVRI